MDEKKKPKRKNNFFYRAYLGSHTIENFHQVGMIWGVFVQFQNNRHTFFFQENLQAFRWQILHLIWNWDISIRFNPIDQEK